MKLLMSLGILLFIINTISLKAVSISIGCDTISENTVWDADTVHVTCTVVVEPGVTLTIMPGTIVKFNNVDNYGGLLVYGSLIAEGTPAEHIVFTAEDTARALDAYGLGWKNLTFNGDKDQHACSKLKYSDISLTGHRFSKAKYGEGAIIAENYNHLIIEHCIIRDNFCYHWESQNGHTFNSGAITVKNSKVDMLYNTIARTSGNCIVITGNSESIINNNYIINEGADYCGPSLNELGILVLSQNNINIINNLITGNSFAIGIVTNNEIGVQLINNTIVRNICGGIYCNAELATIQLINTLLWDGDDFISAIKQINLEACKAIDISYSLIEHGENDIIVEDPGTIVTWEDNLEGDPHFTDPQKGNFSLYSNSIAVNAGICDTTGLAIPALDITGNPRIFEGPYHYRIDMGAYECQTDQEGIIPFVEHMVDQHIRLSDTLLLQVDFIDGDIDDYHTVTVIPDNQIVEIKNLSGHTSGSTYKVISGETGQGICNITVTVTDKFGNTGTDSFKVYVSEASCGNIFEDEVWEEDTVKVYCNITVEEGVTLEIRPGTIVEFQDYYHFNIKGKILAIGTADNPVKFTVQDTTGFYSNTHTGWNGIRFINIDDNADTSKMINCIVEYVVNASALAEEIGGGVKVINSNPVIIDRCLFQYNYARHGGAIYLDNSNIIISNCNILNNKASHYGGGVTVRSTTSVVIKNCRIMNNVAYDGAGIHFGPFRANSNVVNCLIANNHATYRGGGVALNECQDVFLTNNTICFNEAPTGSGVSCEYECFAYLINSIIYNNSCISGIDYQVYIHEPYNIYNAQASFENCDIEGGLSGISGSHSGYTNNIDTDPGFTNSALYDFSLSDNSGCINKGTPDTTGLNLPLVDLAGNPRIYGDTIDIGAYEYFVQEPTNIKAYLSCNLNIYPNPASNTLILEFTEAMHEEYIIELRSITGSVLFSTKMTKNTSGNMIIWDVSTLSNGIYFVTFQNSLYSSIHKIGIIR